MPQLDLYIIFDMFYSVIIFGIFVYLLNIQNLLIMLNLLLRLRKLKIFLEKKYIFKLLQYTLKLKTIIIYKLYYNILMKQLNFIKSNLFAENLEDIRNLKIYNLKIYNLKYYNWIVKIFK